MVRGLEWRCRGGMEDKELFKAQAETAGACPKATEANDGSEYMMITVGHCRNLVAAPKYHAEMDVTSAIDRLLLFAPLNVDDNIQANRISPS